MSQNIITKIVDNLYPKINESLKSPEHNNLKFKIKPANEIQHFFIG